METRGKEGRMETAGTEPDRRCPCEKGQDRLPLWCQVASPPRPVQPATRLPLYPRSSCCTVSGLASAWRARPAHWEAREATLWAVMVVGTADFGTRCHGPVSFCPWQATWTQLPCGALPTLASKWDTFPHQTDGRLICEPSGTLLNL